MEELNESRIELKFDEGRKVFDNAKSIVTWLEEEIATWAWSGTYLSVDRRSVSNPALFFVEELRENSNSLRNLVFEATPITDAQRLQGTDEQVRVIQKLYESKHLIPSSSAFGLFVNSLADKNIESASYALYFFLERNRPDLETPKAVHGFSVGLVQGLLALKEFDDPAGDDVLDTRIKAFSGEAENELKLLRKSESEVREKFQKNEKDLSNLTSDIATKLGQYGKMYESQISTLVSAREQNEAELTRIKEVFEEHMALKAPAEYWSGKSTRHAWYSGGLTVVLIVAFLIGYFVLKDSLSALKPAIHEVVADSANAASQPDSALKSNTSVSNVDTSASVWFPVMEFILLSTGILWLIRILVRLLLSNIHLSIDANERKVMIMTYLALMRGDDEGRYARADDVGALLAAIFRPSSGALVGDEGAPATIYETILSTFQKKS